MNLKKNYYTIKEASEITGIKPYVIRYWEEKFKIIRPIRLRSKHRRYTKNDIENILLIKELIYIKGYSITGVKNVLNGKSNEAASDKTSKNSMLLKHINEEIKSIIKDLNRGH